MNIDLLNLEMNKILAELSSSLGDFQLFFHADRLDKHDSIESEIESILASGLRNRNARDVVYNYSSAERAPDRLYDTFRNWIDIAGVDKSWYKKVINTYEKTIESSSASIRYIQITGCTYYKASLKKRIELKMDYDYFIIKSGGYSFVYEIGGDD